MNSIRITTPALLRKLASSHGMSFSQITEWYCKTKGYDYNEFETVYCARNVQHVRTHRGVATAQLQRMTKKKLLTKFGDRYVVSLEGIRTLQNSGH